MVKVVEFHSRAEERLEGFRSDAKSLPGLVYARYVAAPTSSISKKIKNLVFALRKNKQHIMHAQHRANCITVLSFLIKSMDVRTNECVYVNPKHGIRRNIFISEIARKVQLNERTVTRVLGSLERAKYIIRTATPKACKMLLTYNLFQDLRVSLMLERLRSQLAGLKKGKDKWGDAFNANKKNGAQQSKKSGPTFSRRENESPDITDMRKGEPTEDQKAIAKAHIEQMRLRRRPPPG